MFSHCPDCNTSMTTDIPTGHTMVRTRFRQGNNEPGKKTGRLLVMLLLFLLTACRDDSSAGQEPYILSVSNNEPQSFVTLRIDEVEILSGAGEWVGDRELRLLIIGSDQDEHSASLTCPAYEPITARIGETLEHPCSFGISISETDVIGDLYYLIVALDEDRLSNATGYGLDVLINLLAAGVGKAVKGALVAAELGSIAGSPVLAGGIFLLETAVGYAGGKLVDFGLKPDEIAVQGLRLSRQENWYAGTTHNVVSSDGHMRVVFSIHLTDTPEEVLIEKEVREPSVPPLPVQTDPPSPETTTDLPSPDPSTGARKIEEYEIGRSVNGKSIYVTTIGSGSKSVVLIGGMHAGFVPASVDLAERLKDYFSENPGRVPESITLYVVANANPDSAVGSIESKSGRVNGNNVDVNRNWACNWTSDAVWRQEPIDAGDYPFSEPETKALRDFFVTVDPEAVIFFEAKGSLIAPGTCDGSSRSQTLARIYGAAAGYEVGQITGYVVTGDASDWLDSQGIPSIGVLLPDYTTIDWLDNLDAILAVLAYIS